MAMAQYGAVVGYAVVVAFTVLPLLAVIAVLLDSERPARGWQLTAGYAFGLGMLFTAASFGLAHLPLPRLGDLGLVEALAGAALLLVAGALWLWRRHRARDPRPPRAHGTPSAHQMGAGRAVLVGAQFAIHPENLALTFAAATHVANLTDPQRLVAAALFALVGVSTVALPTVAFTLAGDRTRDRLTALRRAVERHGPLLTEVLLTAAGLVLLGLGCARLLAR
jgi:threonine/homoserine/homoserine lactone efflux protein